MDTLTRQGRALESIESARLVVEGGESPHEDDDAWVEIDTTEQNYLTWLCRMTPGAWRDLTEELCLEGYRLVDPDDWEPEHYADHTRLWCERTTLEECI